MEREEARKKIREGFKGSAAGKELCCAQPVNNRRSVLDAGVRSHFDRPVAELEERLLHSTPSRVLCSDT